MMKLKKALCLLAAWAMLMGSLTGCSLDLREETTEATETEKKKEPATTAPHETETIAEDGTETVTETEIETETEAVTETEATTEAGTEPAKPEEETVPTESEETIVKDQLPDGLTFNGVELTLIGNNTNGLDPDAIFMSGTKGGVVQEAIFERNQAVEQRLDVSINYITTNSTGISASVMTSVQSGYAEYDIMVDQSTSAYGATLSPYFHDLNQLELLDLTRSYWSQSYNQAVSYQGKQFTATGSMLLSPYRGASVTVFNKALFHQANQAYLYDYVEDGSWTLEQQASLQTLLYQGNVCYGFASNPEEDINAYWSALSLDIFTKDEEGKPAYAVNKDRITDAVKSLLGLYHNPTAPVYIDQPDPQFVAPGTVRMFADDRAAMVTTSMLWLENDYVQSMDAPYGVVPMPKLNSNQSEYRTPIDIRRLTVVAVPASVTGERCFMVGAVLEAMGSAGHSIVRSAYLREMIPTDTLQAQKSARIIADGIHVDLGAIYLHLPSHTFSRILQNAVEQGVNNIAGGLKSTERVTLNNLQKLREKLDELFTETDTEAETT